MGPIGLNHIGRYLLEFYFFTYYNETWHQNADDYLQIELKLFDSEDRVVKHVDLDKFSLNQAERQWLKKRVEFQVDNVPSDFKVNY